MPQNVENSTIGTSSDTVPVVSDTVNNNDEPEGLVGQSVCPGFAASQDANGIMRIVPSDVNVCPYGKANAQMNSLVYKLA